MKFKCESLIAGIVAAVLLTAASVKAAQSVSGPIKNVTVYFDRAVVTRVATLELNAGEHTLVFENLPFEANVASYRTFASGAAGITILGLNHRVEQHLQSPQEEAAKLEKVIDELEHVEKQALADRLEALTEQKKLVSSIANGASEEMSKQVSKGGLDVSQWDAAFRFVGRSVRFVNDSIRSINRALAGVDARLKLKRAELANLQQSPGKQTRTVQIDLNLADSGVVNLSLEYMIGGASWKPLYDARISGDSDQVTLTYLAEVSQRTGEDWNDIALTLSTAQPQYGCGPDELIPIFLTAHAGAAGVPQRTEDMLLYHITRVDTTSGGQAFLRGGRGGTEYHEVDGPIGDPLGGLASSGAQLSMASIGAGTYNTFFNVRRPETIPTGEKRYGPRLSNTCFQGQRNCTAGRIESAALIGW
jgi:uncharacterized protein (TIGR02231 family)